MVELWHCQHSVRSLTASQDSPYVSQVNKVIYEDPRAALRCNTPGHRRCHHICVGARIQVIAPARCTYTSAALTLHRLKEITTRKGWLFTLGPTTTLALYQVLPPGPPPGGPSHPPSLWHVEVISLVMQAQPKNVSLPPTDYLQESSQQVLAIAVLMKGLVDLVPPGR